MRVTLAIGCARAWSTGSLTRVACCCCGLAVAGNRYISDPVMQVDNLRKVSVACTSLCMWVHAIDKYSKISRDVVPKQRRLEEMNAALETANRHLAEKQVTWSGISVAASDWICSCCPATLAGHHCACWVQAELAKVVAAVEAKQVICDATAGEKSRLERETETTRARLIRAEKLTKGLASEGVRWKQEVGVVTEQVRPP